MSNDEPKSYGTHLTWEIDKQDRTFRVYVVEPQKYSPDAHAGIFQAALTALIMQPPGGLDADDAQEIKRVRQSPFDLVTFPEAFLPSNDLLSTLELLVNSPQVGCVHVGLRPNNTEMNRHLFNLEELRVFMAQLRNVTRIATADLLEFSNWLEVQNSNSKLNIACLFTIDTTGAVRICLHPKSVRSKFEGSALQDGNLTEADFLAVVTLRPSNRNFKTVTLQPVICSDVLDLSKDNGRPGPLEAVNRDAEIMGKNPPDHIDVVSVATCTPQTEHIVGKYERYITWHERFRDAFRRAMTSPAFKRHHFSAFVLSNFGVTPTNKPAGLSGTFFPVAIRDDKPPKFVAWSCLGKVNKDEDNRWSSPQENYMTLVTDWQSLGYLAYLEPIFDSPEPPARMFGFTFSCFPRDITPTVEKSGLLNCCYRIAEAKADAPLYKFQEARYA